MLPRTFYVKVYVENEREKKKEHLTALLPHVDNVIPVAHGNEKHCELAQVPHITKLSGEVSSVVMCWKRISGDTVLCLWFDCFS